MSSDWYARKLGNPQSRPASAPLPTTPVRPAYPAAPVPTAPNLPPTQPKAAHLKNEDYCPECASGNYFKATPNTAQRCYDCGYPIVQTTSGMRSTQAEGPVQAARQPAQGQGFNPQVIVDRIG